VYLEAAFGMNRRTEENFEYIEPDLRVDDSLIVF